MKNFKIKYIVIPICIVLAIIAVIFVKAYTRDGKWLLKRIKFDNTSVKQASGKIKNLEEQTIIYM